MVDHIGDSAIPETTDIIDQQIRVVLGIKNELARFGLEGLLSSLPLVSAVEVRRDVRGAMYAAAAGRADLLVVAIDELSADEQELLNTRPQEMKLLLLLQRIDSAHTVSSITSDGFLDSQELNVHVLDDTLRQISLGRVPLPSALAKYLIHQTRHDGNQSRPLAPSEQVRLTPREREVLALLVEGRTNKEIAAHLLISQHGVKRLVANVLVKLNCPNRTSAVARALAEGLTDSARPA